MINFLIVYLDIVSGVANILAVLTSLITVLFPFFWSKLKGYRTQIIKILSIFVMVITFLSAKLLPFLTDLFHIESATVVAILASILTFVNFLVGQVEATPNAPMPQLLKRLSMSKLEAAKDVQKLAEKAVSDAKSNTDIEVQKLTR